MASQTIIFSIAISLAVMLQCVIAANQEEDLTNAVNMAAQTIQKAIMNAGDEVAESGIEDAANMFGEDLLKMASRISNAISEGAKTVVAEGNDGADEITSVVQSGADEIANAIHGYPDYQRVVPV